MREANGADLTDDAWEPLREAVPSFRPVWKAYVEDLELYDARLPYANVTKLVEHLAAQAQATDWAELPALFDALESLLRTGSPELQNLLVVGFLEELHRDFEEFDPDLRRLSQCVAGPHAQAAWRRAWEYRHPQQRIFRDQSPNER